ncbi:MAG: S41 family peptidase [Bacteroidia bacterium]
MPRTLLSRFLWLAIGILAGLWLQQSRHPAGVAGSTLPWLRDLVQNRYVDSLNFDSLETVSAQALLTELDPFSTYLPPVQKKAADEVLEGNFDGIGVEFNLLNDSIRVVSALPGGPSDRQGIRSGDRIVQIERKPLPKQGLTNDWVLQNLRGPRGTKVRLGIYRPSAGRLLNYVIVRDRIEIRSVDLAWWAAPGVAHIRINKFGEQTHREFRAALKSLQQEAPVQRLLLDLRGNPGGFLETAVALADEFLAGKKLVTYTQGFHQPRRDYYTQRAGLYEDGELVVLIDQGSASASEILAGALRDHGRARLVGQRSFGKALVQQQFERGDGSAVRLTVARYYTPSGQGIQTPYRSYSDGSPSADSGGIVPDWRLPPAYAAWSEAHIALMETGALAEAAMQYAETSAAQTLQKQGVSNYLSKFTWPKSSALNLIQTSALGPVKLPSNEVAWQALQTSFKAQLARTLFGHSVYLQVLAQNDPVVRLASNPQFSATVLSDSLTIRQKKSHP